MSLLPDKFQVKLTFRFEMLNGQLCRQFFHASIFSMELLIGKSIIIIIIIISLFRTRYIDIFIKYKHKLNFSDTIVLGTLQNLHN